MARRCRAGDQQAWRELVDRHGSLVLALCRRAGLTGDEAGDVCQEVMLSAFRSLGSFRGCRLSTWLYRIASRRIADHFRSSQRRHVPCGSPGQAAAAGDSLQVGEPEPERAADLRAAITGLGEPSRSILVAFYLGDVPVREIAAELGVPANTVKSHLHRGRAWLRSRMGVTR